MPGVTRESSEVTSITIAILNFNGRLLLEATICSALEMDYPAKKFLLVDDGSDDGSVEFVRRRFPTVEIKEMGTNTKMLNRVRNTALEVACTDYVFITDNDITFEPDCLTKLMSAVGVKPDAAVLIPRVMYKHDRTRIYIDRNRFHYVCTGIDPNRDRVLGEVTGKGEIERTWGCGIQLIHKGKAQCVSFFDSDFPMGWGDDGEFHHRLNLAGMTCYAVPDAIVYHEAIKGASRIYGQVRNRFAIIIETYSTRSLCLLFPALILYDVCLFLFLLMKGQQKDYIGAVKSIIDQRGRLLEKRRQVQAQRVVTDGYLFTTGPIYVPGVYRASTLPRIGLATLNMIFDLYWWVVRRFIP